MEEANRRSRSRDRNKRRRSKSRSRDRRRDERRRRDRSRDRRRSRSPNTNKVEETKKPEEREAEAGPSRVPSWQQELDAALAKEKAKDDEEIDPLDALDNEIAAAAALEMEGTKKSQAKLDKELSSGNYKEKPL